VSNWVCRIGGADVDAVPASGGDVGGGHGVDLGGHDRAPLAAEVVGGDAGHGVQAVAQVGAEFDGASADPSMPISRACWTAALRPSTLA
jgi:hypothetical protein